MACVLIVCCCFWLNFDDLDCFNDMFRFYYFFAYKAGNRPQSGPLPITNRVTTCYNPHKWPYKWVAGIIIASISGAGILLITRKGPLCTPLESGFRNNDSRISTPIRL